MDPQEKIEITTELDLGDIAIALVERGCVCFQVKKLGKQEFSIMGLEAVEGRFKWLIKAVRMTDGKKFSGVFDFDKKVGELSVAA